MAQLTEYQLYNISFSYLNGNDISQYCSPSLLISRYQINNQLLQTGCNMAYSLVKAKFRTKYNVPLELEQVAFTNATATATVSGGAVTALNLTYSGTSYATPPNVVFGGPGINASATAIILNGVVTGFTNLVGGTGYTNPPTVMLQGGAADDTRDDLMVKITAILAIENILAGAANVSKETQGYIKWAYNQIQDIRDGQNNLSLQPVAAQTDANGCVYSTQSIAQLVPQSFRTRG